MVLAAYSPEGGGNKIKGGIRRQSNTKVREAGGRATQKYGRLCPTLSLFPPLPLPSPPQTLILSCNEFNRACNQGVNAICRTESFNHFALATAVSKR